MASDLARGSVIWANFDPATGREQAGHRPAIVVSGSRYLKNVPELVIVLMATTTNRGWPQHVPLRGSTGLSKECFAITEQPRTVDRRRITSVVGAVDHGTLAEIDEWLRDFLDLR